MPPKKSKTTPAKKLKTKPTKKTKSMRPTKKSKAVTYKYDKHNTSMRSSKGPAPTGFVLHASTDKYGNELLDYQPVDEARRHNQQRHVRYDRDSFTTAPPHNKHINKELVKLILNIKKANKDTRKSQNNLPAHLMRLNTPQIVSYTEQISPMGKSLKISKSKSYSKAVNSTFSSLTHNGHTHSKGKKIINESTKPFLKVDEMHNGKVHQYMIPKNSIPYKQKLQLEMPRMQELEMPRMQELEMPRMQELEMPRMQELEMPKTTYVVLSRKGKTSMKPKSSTNTNNLMLHNLFTS